MISWRRQGAESSTLEDSSQASSLSWESVRLADPEIATHGRHVHCSLEESCRDCEALTFSPALPTLLWHSAQIAGGAAAMSILGGLLIYATIISFTLFFQEDQEF